MTHVTVRDIEDEWVAQAEAEAKEKGVSVNTVFREAIRRGLVIVTKRQTNGLEKFAGCLPFESEDELRQWNENMKVFDRVDRNLHR